METFKTGNWVAWNEGVEHDENDLGNFLMLQEFFGDGPFMVIGILPVPKKDARALKHSQFLQLADQSGNPILQKDGSRSKFSGYWFTAIAAPHRLIN